MLTKDLSVDIHSRVSDKGLGRQAGSGSGLHSCCNKAML